MKVPLSWLKEYLATSASSSQIADCLNSLGLEVDGAHEKEGDVLFELGLTPNLNHASSVYGVARELSALTQDPLHFPAFSVKESIDSIAGDIASVTVEAKNAAPAYTCRVIEVKVGPSPLWLQKRLEQIGIRSVNNVVDVTNYVLHELGHPLHAFDLDTISEKKVTVRFAKSGESLIALNDKEYFPTIDTLLICDAKGPIALAGIMGGKETEVSDTTTRILLESAYFDPTVVRKASKRMGLITEGSRRFERGADRNALISALDRATSLLQEVASAKVFAGILQCDAEKVAPRVIALRLPQVERLLGLKLSMNEAATLFSRLHFTVKSTKNDSLEVEIPSYRNDVQGEIDLIEEVARLYGYDNLYDDKKTVTYIGSKQPPSPLYLFAKAVTNHLLGHGLQELMTCDLISPVEASLISPDCFPSRSLIKLLNPSSQDQSYLRPTMLPNALKVVKYNADREKHAIAGFEVGRIHFKSKETYLEPHVASIVLSGAKSEYFWDGANEAYDFFDLKGILEGLFHSLRITEFSWTKSSFETFHPGRQARIFLKDRDIGIMGEIHPKVLKKVGINQPVLFAEINLDDLLHILPPEKKMAPLAEYPSSYRDWTLTLPFEKPIGDLLKTAHGNASPLLESVHLRGIYTGEKVQPGMKNVTLRFVYRDKTKTLSLQEVDSEHSRLTSLMQNP